MLKEFPLSNELIIAHKMKEFKIMKDINHPNINYLKEYFLHNGNLYIVSEFCDKGSLETYIENFNNLNFKRVRKIALEILLIIENLHLYKITH